MVRRVRCERTTTSLPPFDDPRAR
jgi:hypothetical protein